MPKDQQRAIWERRQAEIWNRIFQVIEDVVSVAENVEDSTGITQLKEKLIDAATGVGADMVRANASQSNEQFEDYINEARMKAIEADYWLRLMYILQQRKDVEHDLSNVISQYTDIINLLNQFIKHTHNEPDAVKKHTKGSKVNL